MCRNRFLYIIHICICVYETHSVKYNLHYYCDTFIKSVEKKTSKVAINRQQLQHLPFYVHNQKLRDRNFQK